MQKENVKIAIIGGGLIGLYLASKLSKQGHSVSVFDKKSEKDLGKKVCSALFSERILGFIPQATDCIKNEINGCVINFPKKKVKLNFNPKHLIIDREKLSTLLAKEAKNNLVQIIYEQELKELPTGFDFIIGCDGAGSIVRRLLGLPNPKIMIGAQIFIERPDKSNYVSTYPTKSGFGWKIPIGDCIEYGIMGDPKNTEKEFADFLEQQQIEKPKIILSAAIPQPNLFFKDAGLVFSSEENITLCGDACGLTKPWSGGGIIWGLTQADILSENFPDFKKYKKQVIKKFRPLIIKGQISKRLIYFAGNYLPMIIPSKLTYDNDFPSFFKSLLSTRDKG